MNRILFTTILLVFVFVGLLAQTDTIYYLNSDFENSEQQKVWSSVPSDEVIYWNYHDGGYSYPLTAQSGSLNAILHRSDVGITYVFDLVSDPIDLSNAIKPQLTFWYALAPTFLYQDEMILMFKAGADSEWDTVINYYTRQDDWEDEVFNIDSNSDGVSYLVEDFQMAFRGIAKGGQGVCIDNVIIEEKAIINKFVKDFSVSEVSHAIVPSGATLPLVKVNIDVLGNNGNSNIDSITFLLAEGEAGYFKNKGFSLYHTRANNYKTVEQGESTQVGADVSVVDGKIKFNNLNKNLFLGDNYFWLTARLNRNIPHKAKIRIDIDSGSVHAIDTALPLTRINSVFDRQVEESFFFDDFEADSGWILQGDFERDTSKGLGSSKSKDPEYAYSLETLLGTDLTGDGLHADTINGTNSYSAISPMWDLAYYNNVKIHMKKWIDFSTADRASISITNNGGKTWTRIWENHIDNESFSPVWGELLFENEKTSMLNRQDSVQLKFTIDTTLDALPYIGFNIDNFAITANLLEADVGITSFSDPYEDCRGFYNDTVKIVVKNYAYQPTPAEIPVFFGLYGIEGPLVWDTIKTSINPGESTEFTFSTTANFPQGDIYDKFIVGTALDSDEDSTNNTMSQLLYIQESITPAHTEDFEYKGGIWRASENSSWEAIDPDFSIGSLPGSEQAWVLSPDGSYWSDDTSYIYSGCYNLTGANRHIIELSYWLDSEEDIDGFTIEYTTNDGETWTTIDTSQYGIGWGWYTDTVATLGKPGFSGFIGEWKSMREILPLSLSYEPKVKFRVLWGSDEENTARGLAIDDFKIYPAPIDVGVCNIQLPGDTCLWENPSSVTVYVKNNGYNNLPIGKQIIVGVDFEDGDAFIDSVPTDRIVVPGDSIAITIDPGIVMETPGNYSLIAYTLTEYDPWFYQANNDTLGKSFEVWPLPEALLIDTIESREPDTVVIRASNNPLNSYVWSDMSTADTLKVPGPGTYYITVTESVHGCRNFDSTYVELLYNDVGISQIVSPISDCWHGSSEMATVRIQNYGTDSLIANDVVRIALYVDGIEAIRDTLVLTESLYEGTYLDYQMQNNTIDFSDIKTYQLTSFTEFGGDTVKTNDTLYTSITTYGYPTVSIGPDTVAKALNYTFKAESGFVSYLWNTGDDTSQITTDSSGWYSVTIYDSNNCPDTDSAYLRLKIRDVQPVEMFTPVSTCGGDANTPVMASFVNNGNDTLLVGDTVIFTYTVNDTFVKSDIIKVPFNMLPAQKMQHVFADSLDVTAVQDYKFVFTAQTTGDLRTWNDTIYDSIATNKQPVVDFGVSYMEIKALDTILDAGAGEHLAYLWGDGTTKQTYDVRFTGTYWVTATDTLTGCYDADTIDVLFDILDYKISSISLENYCQGTSIDSFNVTVQNNSSWKRDSAYFDLIFKLNNGLADTQSYKINEPWPVFETKTFAVNKPFYFDSAFIQNMDVRINHPGDLRPGNNSNNKGFIIRPLPAFAFAYDSLEGFAPYVIDAGPGYNAYLWQDGSNEQTYTVSTDSIYIVTVFNNYGCSVSDSVYVDVEYIGYQEVPLLQNEIVLYPNPASNRFTIDIKNDAVNYYGIEMYNSNNQRVYSGELNINNGTMEMDIKALPSGLYYLKILSDKGIVSKKILVE